MTDARIINFHGPQGRHYESVQVGDSVKDLRTRLSVSEKADVDHVRLYYYLSSTADDIMSGKDGLHEVTGVRVELLDDMALTAKVLDKIGFYVVIHVLGR